MSARVRIAATTLAIVVAPRRLPLSIELNPRGLAFSPTYTEADALKQGLGPLGPVILGVQTYLGQGKLAGQLLAGDGKEFRTKLSAADQKAATLIAAQYSTYYANKYTNQSVPTHTSTTPSANPTFTTYDINGLPAVYDQGGYEYAVPLVQKLTAYKPFIRRAAAQRNWSTQPAGTSVRG